MKSSQIPERYTIITAAILSKLINASQDRTFREHLTVPGYDVMIMSVHHEYWKGLHLRTNGIRIK